MPVKEADPEAQSLDAVFAGAMGAPARPKEPAAPPAIDPDAPHGHDDQGRPLAPYGLTKDGKPKRSAAGRPSKEDRARVAPAGPAGDARGNEPQAVKLATPGQYARPLAETADSVWFGLSALATTGPRLPLIGKMLPGDKINATAAVWFVTKDRAVAAVSLAAEHSAAAARFAAKLEGGDITWMLTCVSLVAPITDLLAMVWHKNADVQLQQANQPTIAELAAKNDAAMQKAIAMMTAKMAEAAAEQIAKVQEAG